MEASSIQRGRCGSGRAGYRRPRRGRRRSGHGAEHRRRRRRRPEFLDDGGTADGAGPARGDPDRHREAAPFGGRTRAVFVASSGGNGGTVETGTGLRETEATAERADPEAGHATSPGLASQSSAPRHPGFSSSRQAEAAAMVVAATDLGEWRVCGRCGTRRYSQPHSRHSADAGRDVDWRDRRLHRRSGRRRGSAAAPSYGGGSQGAGGGWTRVHHRAGGAVLTTAGQGARSISPRASAEAAAVPETSRCLRAGGHGRKPGRRRRRGDVTVAGLLQALGRDRPASWRKASAVAVAQQALSPAYLRSGQRAARAATGRP